MKWNLPLWYIPMIFLMELMSYWIFKLMSSKKRIGILLIFSILVAGGIYYADAITNLPFGAETVIYLYPFFVFGKFLREKAFFSSIVQNKVCRRSVGTFCFAVGSVATTFTQNVDYIVDEYRNYSAFIAIALCIIFGTLLLFSGKQNGLRVCNYVGKHTMAILLLHTFPRMFLISYVPFISILYERYTLITSVLISLIIIPICLFVALPINYLLRLVFKQDRVQI